MSQGIAVKDDFPAGFHDAFGRMIMWFGRIECLMEVLRLQLGGTNAAGAAADAESRDDFDRQRRELQALYDARVADPMQRLALAKVLGRLVPLWEYRNDCVHCCWQPEKDGLLAYRSKPLDGKVQWRAHRTTVAKMDEVAKAIAMIYVALDQLTRLSLSAPATAAAA